MAREPDALPSLSSSRRQRLESLVAPGIVDKLEYAVIVREISMATDQTESFFHALAPAFVANVLTVALVYCFVMINQREKHGEEGKAAFHISG
jgi:hypothetical protein